MIKKITITNYLKESITFELSDENPSHGLKIEKITGLGPPLANINRTSLATTDGSLYNSSRLDDRNIVINFLLGFAPTVEDTRQRTYKYMPIKKNLEFFIETDNRAARIKGHVEKNEPDIFSKDESAVISIICEDPYFYSDDVNTTIFYGIEPLFEFIFSNESLEEDLIEFGSIENEQEKTIWYDGDAEVGITITIHALGPAENITIYNTLTRESMRIDTAKLEELTKSGVVAGDDIIISTVRNNKTITLLRGGYYTNILNCLDKGSDWFQLSKGDNIFAYTADAGAENLEFKIENQVIYEGV